MRVMIGAVLTNLVRPILPIKPRRLTAKQLHDSELSCEQIRNSNLRKFLVDNNTRNEVDVSVTPVEDAKSIALEAESGVLVILVGSDKLH